MYGQELYFGSMFKYLIIKLFADTKSNRFLSSFLQQSYNYGPRKSKKKPRRTNNFKACLSGLSPTYD